MVFSWLILLQGSVLVACQICPQVTKQSCPMMTLGNGNAVQSVLKVVTSPVDFGLPPEFIRKGYCCAIPDCLSNPCQYRGTCEETETGFNCTCLQGYYGNRCEYADTFIRSLDLLGGSENEGRIAFTSNSPHETYMSIHQVDWSRHKSQLVCQYLGFEDAYATVSGDLFEVSSLDNMSQTVRVRCPANVKSITECWYDELDDEIPIRRDESIAVVCCAVNLCNTPQGFAVGLETGQIPNSAITVSSNFSYLVDKRKARLNGPSAWKPQIEDVNPWLQIAFEHIFVISAIITQGRAHENQWVTSYTISTNFDDQEWVSYTDTNPNAAKVFTGNYDRGSFVVHNFQRPIVCHKLRVYPKTHDGHRSLRLELTGYGPINGAIAALNNGEPSCSSPIRGEGMGVEDGRIPDSQLTYSSSWNNIQQNSAPNDTINDGVDDTDEDKWVKIDLGKICNVTGVITQGSPQLAQWTTSVSLSYSRDDVTWTYALKPECGVRKVYAANYDNITQKTILFPRPVTARYVRIHPLTWFTGHSMRYEVLGIP